MGLTRILVSALIPFLLLPFCTILVLLIVRPFLQISVSWFQHLAGAHFTWMPDSLFLDRNLSSSSDRTVPSPNDASVLVTGYDREVAQTECTICLCGIMEGEAITELRCKHLFHRSCLNRWLEFGHATCPLCRHSLKPNAKVMEMEFMGLDALELEWIHIFSTQERI